MIDFKPITIDDKSIIQQSIHDGIERGCEYSFTHLFLWGKQHYTMLHNHIVLFSQYNSRLIYPFPVGSGDKKVILDAIIEDSKERDISCLIGGLYGNARQIINELYPGKFSFCNDRDAYDYVYSIDDLADLSGRKYHKKRTHINHFKKRFLDYTVETITQNNLHKAKHMIDMWYRDRLDENPENNYDMEQVALKKAFDYYDKLQMDGLMLLNGNDILAVTMGSPLSENTFDIHFEKARWDVDGAYTAICNEFAKYIRDKYPNIQYLNREDDMGIEGLRKSKESYYPHHMIEKGLAYYKTN